MPNPNAPTAPSQSSSSIIVFPTDLFTSTNTPDPIVTGGGPNPTSNARIVTTASQGFYTQIQLVEASSILTGIGGAVSTGIGGTGAANPQNGSGVYLPLPWKINDVEVHAWNDLTFLDDLPVLHTLANLARAGTRAIGSNLTVNPFMYMMYKQPLFREFELAWAFSPNNAQESIILSEIINYIKMGALPEYRLNGLALDLPYIALVRINPNEFMFDFKPCAIISVNIDYTGSGHGPSFYRDGAPTIVSFTIGLKEVEIQVRQDIAWRGGSLTAGLINGVRTV